MATYLAHDALRLPAASLLANSGLCVNIEIKIWLLLGVNVDTALKILIQLISSSGPLKLVGPCAVHTLHNPLLRHCLL